MFALTESFTDFIVRATTAAGGGVGAGGVSVIQHSALTSAV